MVIKSTAQISIASGQANSIAANPPKAQQRRDSAVESSDAISDRTLAISSRRAEDFAQPSSQIDDESGAQQITEFLRSHILTSPSASLSVQANSHPQAVLELLDGIFG